MNSTAIQVNPSTGRCTVTSICCCCESPFINDTLPDIFVMDVPEICPECLATAENIAGEDVLTELLGDGELDLYYATVKEINQLLRGGTELWN